MRWLGMFKDKDATSPGELPPRINVVFVKPKLGGVSKHAGDEAEAGTVRTADVTSTLLRVGKVRGYLALA